MKVDLSSLPPLLTTTATAATAQTMRAAAPTRSLLGVKLFVKTHVHATKMQSLILPATLHWLSTMKRPSLGIMLGQGKKHQEFACAKNYRKFSFKPT
jgi:hypothetical protein